uniref:ADAM metallopeptidase with thrombospondin type 1 motif 8 n=1 Tax=Zosterops lateralis melanops TaxID=1220523 RepID=A0A8D2PUT4_ZOSLA
MRLFLSFQTKTTSLQQRLYPGPSLPAQNHILTLMSMAAHIYRHPSLRNSISLVVVKVLVVEEAAAGPEVSDNGGLTLRNFCSWQQRFNPASDRHPEHYDTAILLTRQVSSSHPWECPAAGGKGVRASLEGEKGVDRGGRSRAVPDTGRGESNQTTDRGVGCPAWCNQWHPALKSPSLPPAPCPGDCLLDAPAEPVSLPAQLPGQRALYSLDQQCQQIFGKDFQHCPNTTEEDICSQLWCRTGSGEPLCHTKNGSLPWADGTPCKAQGLCWDGRCVQQDPAVDGGWGPWSAWGSCSRSCGGGIQFSHRHCDSPRPRHGGAYCQGQRTKYQSCHTQECPFREQQCEKYNSYNFTDLEGNHLEWVPKYAGVSPRDRCKLFCRARGRSEFKVFEAKVRKSLN